MKKLDSPRSSPAIVFRFGNFELDTGRFELRSSHGPVALEPQTFRVLQYLVEQRERLVTRDDLVQTIWQGKAISDWTVSGAIKSARSALGDTGDPRKYIRTVHGKGFRFIADVERRIGAGQADDGTPSIAVLPFASIGSTTDREYFADGITEDLITDLSGIPGLTVVSRNSIYGYRGSVIDARAIGRTFGVGHLLQGSVRQSGQKIRINAQLIAAETGDEIWAERFDGSKADIFSLQDAVTARILSTLNLHLVAGNSGRRQRTTDPEAYDLCLRGRSEYYLYTPDHLAKALAFFEEATEKDPAFAEAYAYQAYCRNSLFVFAWPGSDDNLDRALSLADKAIDLNAKSAVAHARRGWILGYLGRPEETVESFETAIALDSQNAEVFMAYGETLNRLGDPKRGLPLLEEAFSIDTFVPPSWDFTRGHSMILLREYERALGYILPVLDRVPRFIPARVQLARAYAEMGRSDDARNTVNVIREFAPRYDIANAKRMFPYPQKVELDRLVSALLSAGMSG